MKIKDERIVQINNKIQKEAYFVVLFLAIISILVKSYILDLSFSHYITELSILILSSFYIAIRSMFLGHSFMSSFRNSKIVMLSAILILSLVVSIVNGIKNYSLYGSHYTGIFDGNFIAVFVFTFISSALFICVTLAFLCGVNKAGQQKLEKKLKEEEQD